MRTIDADIRWNGNGTYTPHCRDCGYEGKPRHQHAVARAAVRQHRCGNEHRRAVRVEGKA